MIFNKDANTINRANTIFFNRKNMFFNKNNCTLTG